MKQRFRSIFNLKTKKSGTAVIAAVLTLILASGALVGRRALAGELPSVSPFPASPSVSESPSSSPANTDEEKALELAKAWAEAVKIRDGKAQYALYTIELQKNLHDAYEGLNWVTGTSSPWVERYTVELIVSGATVTFVYTTSTGPAGEYDACLEFVKEGETLKIGKLTNLELILGDAPSISDAGLLSAGCFVMARETAKPPV